LLGWAVGWLPGLLWGRLVSLLLGWRWAIVGLGCFILLLLGWWRRWLVSWCLWWWVVSWGLGRGCRVDWVRWVDISRCRCRWSLDVDWLRRSHVVIGLGSIRGIGLLHVHWGAVRIRNLSWWTVLGWLGLLVFRWLGLLVLGWFGLLVSLSHWLGWAIAGPKWFVLGFLLRWSAIRGLGFIIAWLRCRVGLLVLGRSIALQRLLWGWAIILLGWIINRLGRLVLGWLGLLVLWLLIIRLGWAVIVILRPGWRRPFWLLGRGITGLDWLGRALGHVIFHLLWGWLIRRWRWLVVRLLGGLISSRLLGHVISGLLGFNLRLGGGSVSLLLRRGWGFFVHGFLVLLVDLLGWLIGRLRRMNHMNRWLVV